MAQKSKKHTDIERVSLAGIEAGMSPVGLITYSEWFLAAGKQMAVPSEMAFMPVRDYLVCHSLELALKAFLSLKGYALTKLAGGQYGHYLEKILAEADREDLPDMVKLDDSQRFQITRASKYYSEKVFEYPAVGEAAGAYPQRPNTIVLIGAAEALIAALREPCRQAP